MVQGVPYVQSLEGSDQKEGGGDGTDGTCSTTDIGVVLFVDHGEIECQPSNESRVEFAEFFQIQRTDARVEFPADEEVVEGDSGGAASGQHRSLGEGSGVEVDGEEGGEGNGGGEEGNVVVVGPREVEGVGVEAKEEEDGSGDPKHELPVELVGETFAVGELDAFEFGAGEDEVEGELEGHPGEEDGSGLQSE